MKKITEESITKLADAAFRRVAQKVMERAEQTGTPIIVWEEGAVKEITPKQARARAGLQKAVRKKVP